MANISTISIGIAFPKEEWRPVVGYEGYYEVSDLGRVRSVDRVITCKNGSTRKLKGKLMSLNPCPMGYLGTSLYTPETGGVRFLAHRLVAEAFIPNPEGKPHVNHKNGTKWDNKLSNLEWCTPSENVQHAHDTGLITVNFGSDCIAAKLTDEDVLEICKLLDSGASQIEIASKYGVHETSVNAIHTGRKWNHLTNRAGNVIHYGNNKGANNYRSKAVVNCRGEVFDTVTKASIAYNLRSTTNICHVCLGKRRYSGTYEDGTPISWKYV